MVVKIERKRYLLVEFAPKPPELKQMISLLRRKVAELGGQFQLAQSSLHVVDIIDNYAIIRSTHEYRDLVETAIQLVDYGDAIPKVVVVSGTIKKVTSLISPHLELIDEEE